MAVSSSTVRAAAPSKNPLIYNITSPGSANTEFSQVLSTNTKQFIVKARGNATLKVAFVSGESSTNYITLSKHASLSQENLDATITLYMQCDKASEVIEILEWT